jgi:hypothetical protein
LQGDWRKEEVLYACNACHAIRLVTRQRLPRDCCDQLPDRMVEEQGTAELTAEERRVILEYLATQCGRNSPRSSASGLTRLKKAAPNGSGP